MTFAWDKVIKKSISEYTTPFYISAWSPIIFALDELKILEGILPITHWLSFKTHPVAPLLRKWHSLQLGVEVVSEYEFMAALKEGFRPDFIVVNGVAKNRWLSKYKIKGIRVHFDSLREVEELAANAKAFRWRIGIRFHVSEEYDPDEPEFGGQFGMVPSEIKVASKKLRDKGIKIESIHFHLRSNVSDVNSYRKALEEVSIVCNNNGLSPQYIDCGGGLPLSSTSLTNKNTKLNSINLKDLRKVFSNIPSLFPEATEIWMENGRFITGRSAVLVVKVLDIKDRDDSRYLICDGGRTNHALVSDWETHEIFTIPNRNGRKCLTTICGPTCMAFDRLLRTYLPQDIQIGDYIVWKDAGAYHIPWETRFSHGLAKVIWHDEDGELMLARKEETFDQWWSKWQ